MRKSARTRQYIIEQTAEIFNKRGFEGTSLSSLQDATGLTKGSLYGNFKDKEEIAFEAFAYAMKVTRDAVNKKVATKTTAKGKLLAILSFYSQYVFNSPIPGGCPLLNNAVEADDFHLSFRTMVSHEIDLTINAIADLIEEGKKKMEFNKDIRSLETAYILFTSIEGAIMVSRVSGSEKAMRVVVAHCKSILDQISLK
jgi:TetR/AcrR family transcriptional regulator, transcriptional repressor for nem operon